MGLMPDEVFGTADALATIVGWLVDGLISLFKTQLYAAWRSAALNVAQSAAPLGNRTLRALVLALAAAVEPANAPSITAAIKTLLHRIFMSFPVCYPSIDIRANELHESE